MDWRVKGLIAAALVAIFSLITIQHNRIESLTKERDKYRTNTETLLTDVETFRVRDSLNAARVQSLELTMKEFERFRADDARLIKELQGKNRDLATVNKAQAQTIINLQAIPRDTVVLRDSVMVPAVAVHCGDEWYTFDGVLTPKSFDGTLSNRESLLVAESVRYKRILFWKTKRIKDRQTNVVSKNPHTTITNVEYVVIEN